jgi:hypothetical protein
MKVAKAADELRGKITPQGTNAFVYVLPFSRTWRAFSGVILAFFRRRHSKIMHTQDKRYVKAGIFCVFFPSFFDSFVVKKCLLLLMSR